MDGSSDIIFTEDIVEGSDIIMTGSAVPSDEAICSIFDNSGTLLQTFVVNTSGEVDLFLKDTFGSFELLGCDDQDCAPNVTYTYTVTNTGTVSVTLTKFERVRDDAVLDLLPSDPVEIPAGGTSSQSETEPVDICVDMEHVTTVEIEAFPPTGLVCPAQAEYFWETQVDCRVDVEIVCVTEDGTACTDLAPLGSCSLDDITELKFTYVATTCDQSLNTQDGALCTDLSPFPASGNVSIACVDANDASSSLVVTPDNVVPGDSLVVTTSDNSLLPSEVKCTVLDGATAVQEFSFFTGDGNALSLKDSFGSIELVSCQDETGALQSCEVQITYTYTITNLGTNDMDLTMIESTRDNVTESLMTLLNVTNLKPGDETSLTEAAVVDLCQDQIYLAEVEIEANPPNGLACFDEAAYEFSTEVSCKVDVDITCESSDGVACTDLTAVDGAGGSETCLMEVTYQYEITNFGTNDMDLTLIERSRGNTTAASLLDLLSVTSLSPGQATTVTEQDTIDLCLENDFRTSVFIEADPPNALTCADDAEYEFSIKPPCQVISTFNLDADSTSFDITNTLSNPACLDLCRHDLLHDKWR